MPCFGVNFCSVDFPANRPPLLSPLSSGPSELNSASFRIKIGVFDLPDGFMFLSLNCQSIWCGIPPCVQICSLIAKVLLFIFLRFLSSHRPPWGAASCFQVSIAIFSVGLLLWNKFLESVIRPSCLISCLVLYEWALIFISLFPFSSHLLAFPGAASLMYSVTCLEWPLSVTSALSPSV